MVGEPWALPDSGDLPPRRPAERPTTADAAPRAPRQSRPSSADGTTTPPRPGAASQRPIPAGSSGDTASHPAGERRSPSAPGTSTAGTPRAGGESRTPSSSDVSATGTSRSGAAAAPRAGGGSQRPAPTDSPADAVSRPGEAPGSRGPRASCASGDVTARPGDGGTRASRPFQLPRDPKPSSGSSAGTAPSSAPGATDAPESPRHEPTHHGFPGRRTTPASPPPPPASARFPDAPPAGGHPGVPHPGPARRTPVPEDGITETTRRLRSIPTERPVEAPALASPAFGTARPYVSFAEPETYDDALTRPRHVGGRTRPRAAAAAACVVLGLGLIGGAVAGSWLTGDGTGADGTSSAFVAAGSLWHSVPVDQLFPPTVQGQGAGPGGADRTWTRLAVAPDSGCANAFDPLLSKALAPAGCLRLLRATYTDATRSQVTTVGLLFTKADPAAMAALKNRFQQEGLDRRTDLMPRPYAVKGTAATGFGDAQRASWKVSVLTDAPVVVYAVSGFADGRIVTAPQPAADAVKPGATTAPAQAGLGHDAQGLADRIERSLRKTVGSATEKPS
ncbi:hypothetical protein OG819_26675 [Streptomyces sp. NBC_01549]|uniref:hypothetical protein n=1 Tax=Streptomyces sp. NBC_01549 TaxID=2975874 RepID=UPI00224D2242|nr:hypothetical protein [Streptomyces sp. NBC_01549]MCX4593207.1 hypothetical protein [Streptomyces sp. NBC_01549]